MPGRNRPPEPSDGQPTPVGDLMATVEALRADLRELRSGLAEEVRTRRVILVENDGFERLVAATRDGFAHVTLSGRTADGRVTCVELFVNDPIAGTGAHVGVALTSGDDVVAVFETVDGARPRVWIADEGGDEPPE